jgi:hypothetical protein
LQRFAMLRVLLSSCFAAALGAVCAGGSLRAADVTGAAVLFSASQAGCAVVIPADATAEERRAAELIAATLAKAAGRATAAFPIVMEGGEAAARGIFVGATRRAGDFLAVAARPPFDTAVGSRSDGRDVIVRSERRASVERAAGWFLERQLGAHWFMPGPLGEVIPRRGELVVPAGEEVVHPGFISRDLGGIEGEGGREWFARNGLEERFEFGHALTAIFRAEDLRRQPEMAPRRGGRRYFPSGPGDYNWQPDLTNPAAIAHATAAALRAFGADPQRVSFSLSENDSIRFDDSPATLAAVGPARFFRGRPDYSNLVFGFTNEVARRVGEKFPDRWIGALAYYWTEQVPAFPVEKNVIPFLTAERVQWFEPEFAVQDRDLIERWCRSGAGLVGVYDYFYGAPLLVPRPELATIAESIPFEHRAGVRAFYAETSPNWALDGPKPWLAAQLLWAPERKPDELLETYYREFWAEAAAPMREFFGTCERVWREQPRPGYWIKYFRDEHQAGLFPPEVRAKLRDALAAARGLARSPEVRARVEFAAAGFAASDAFVVFCERRDRLSALAREGTPVDELGRAWLAYFAARNEFGALNARVRAAQPAALAPQPLDIYFRSEPASRAAWELARSEPGRSFLTDHAWLAWLGTDATPRDVQRIAREGAEVLLDPRWTKLDVRPVGGATDFEWTPAAQPWRGKGEPVETRHVEKLAASAEAPVVLRFSGCRQESLGQWVAATPGDLYAAQVKVRAKVSPGNATLLIVSFLDENQQHLGIGRTDRLPAAEGVQELELRVIASAPPGARWVGFGLQAGNQVNDDFAEFKEASLRRLPRESR